MNAKNKSMNCQIHIILVPIDCNIIENVLKSSFLEQLEQIINIKEQIHYNNTTPANCFRHNDLLLGNRSR